MQSGTDWTPFYEVEEALEQIRWLVFHKWSKRNLRRNQVPVAKDVQDALDDMRPIVREAFGTWRRLARYLPRPGSGHEEEE